MNNLEKFVSKNVAVLALALPSTAHALTVDGSNSLSGLIGSVLSSCSAPSIVFSGRGGDLGEQAMLDQGFGVPGANQLVSPMARYLSASRTCEHPTAAEAEGRLLAFDATAIMVSSATAANCSEPPATQALSIRDVNGEPGLQCPGCSGSDYLVEGWRDALALALAGVHHGDPEIVDCDSDVRHSLANDLSQLTQRNCTSGSCSAVRHLFRPTDRAAESFAALLGITSQGERPFCNGTTTEDEDPVRRGCVDGEQVCSADGTLGWLLPVPDTTAFATSSCQAGAFGFRTAALDATTQCVDGTSTLFGLCLVPLTNGGSASCLNTDPNNVSILALALAPKPDGRSYNLEHRQTSGSLRTNTFGEQQKASFQRIHSTASLAGHPCTEPDAAQQTSCLTQASPCSVGLTPYRGSSYPEATALPVEDVAPNEENIRLAANGTAAAYPLSEPLFLNTMVGFENVALGSPQWQFGFCLGNGSVVSAAASAAGLVPLEGLPQCIDFDERQCPGALPLNKDNCKSISNRCPVFEGFSVSPLATSVGSSIALSTQVRDFDDSELTFLWTATEGHFDTELEVIAGTPEQVGSETSHAFSQDNVYNCTSEGTHTLTFRAWDGSCDSPESRYLRHVDVTCTGP